MKNGNAPAISHVRIESGNVTMDTPISIGAVKKVNIIAIIATNQRKYRKRPKSTPTTPMIFPGVFCVSAVISIKKVLLWVSYSRVIPEHPHNNLSGDLCINSVQFLYASAGFAEREESGPTLEDESTIPHYFAKFFLLILVNVFPLSFL